MRSQASRKPNPKFNFALAPCVVALAALWQPAFATLDIPTAPLQSAAAVPSNILFVLDDSGSMQFEMMPDDLTIFPVPAYSNTPLGVYLFPPPATTNAKNVEMIVARFTLFSSRMAKNLWIICGIPSTPSDVRITLLNRLTALS